MYMYCLAYCLLPMTSVFDTNEPVVPVVARERKAKRNTEKSATVTPGLSAANCCDPATRPMNI